MSKTVYISERLLKEEFLIDELPEDINSALKSNKTAFGNNPAFPEIYDDNFVDIVANSRFNFIRNEIKKIGKIDNVNEKTVSGLLSRLIIECEKEEENIKSNLEKLCYNYVINLFNVPDGFLDIEVKLSPEIDLKGKSFQVDRIKGSFDFDDYTSAEQLKNEVYKRRIINALCMGAGMVLSSDIKQYAGDLYELNPKLPELYRNILILNNYLIFTKENFDISDTDPKQFGNVLLTLGNDENKSKITATAKIFPVLLSETIKGFMELFASHGLPSDLNLANEIIKRADYVKAEPWDMRIGPELWKMFKESGDINNEDIPYVFRRICLLSVDDFNKYFKNIFSSTKRGKEMTKTLIDKAIEDFEENDSDKMKNADVKKDIISDDYIREDEL